MKRRPPPLVFEATRMCLAGLLWPEILTDPELLRQLEVEVREEGRPTAARRLWIELVRRKGKHWTGEVH